MLLLLEENNANRRGSRTATKRFAPIDCGADSDTNKSFDLLQLFPQDEEIWRIALVAVAAGPLIQNLVANAVAVVVAGDIIL